jgi:hypothetical protein
LTPLLAGALVALSLVYCWRVLSRCRELSRATLAEEDELELRLAEKELVLELALGRRAVRALGRATLFGGTGFAVWELTGGSSHYPGAGVAFILGFVGWAGAGEVERRIGLLADARGHAKKTLNQQGDKPFRTS